MSILNDREIRSLCLIPTHKINIMGPSTYYSSVNGVVYHVETGRSYTDDAIKYLDLIAVNEVEHSKRMITPFEPCQVKTRNNQGKEEKIISYGTSSMGYDVRLGTKFKIFTNTFNALIDPLDMPENAYIDYEGDSVIIPPNSYILGHTIEHFEMPNDVAAICVGKSTYARAGCVINVTPIEPGFSGTVVIEIANCTPLPMRIHSGMGVAQFIFLRGKPCETSYADRGGKYQGQSGVQTAIA